jgi:hypothetical protein
MTKVNPGRPIRQEAAYVLTFQLRWQCFVPSTFPLLPRRHGPVLRLRTLRYCPLHRVAVLRTRRSIAACCYSLRQGPRVHCELIASWSPIPPKIVEIVSKTRPNRSSVRLDQIVIVSLCLSLTHAFIVPRSFPRETTCERRPDSRHLLD